MTLDWFFRQAWRRLTGLPEESPPQKMPDLDEIRQRQWSPEFVELMQNRFVIGAFRYGFFGRQKSYDHLEAIERKCRLYRETGNDEFLVDIANYALAEFVVGEHPQKHFSALDDHHHLSEADHA